MITARAKAKGKREGESIVIECIEYDGEDDDKRHVVILKNGAEDEYTSFLLNDCVFRRYARNTKFACCYNPPFNSAAAYWLALHEDYFDEPPEIETEGNVEPVEYSKEELQRIRF